MIFKIEIDLDWFDDDKSFDEIVKDEITTNVINKISDSFTAQLESDSMNKIAAKLNEAAESYEAKVDDIIREKFNEYVSNRVTVTNRWGKAVHEDITIEELIEKRIDDYLSRDVDGKGRALRSHDYSSTKMHYIEWLLAEKVEKACRAMTDNITEQVENSIKNKVNEELKSQISSELMSKIDIDSVVAKVFRLEG